LSDSRSRDFEEEKLQEEKDSRERRRSKERRELNKVWRPMEYDVQ
jgi:hypothetical protein